MAQLDGLGTGTGTRVPALVPLVPDRYDLDATVRRYVRTALDAVRLGEEYWYSVAPTVMNGPGGTPTAAYVVTMYARDPGHVGRYLVEGVVQTGFPTEDEMTAIVEHMVTSLRNQSSARLR
jgi:hypothetical protein